MTRDELRALVAEENPDAYSADGFEEAFVGFARRCGQPTLAVYDVDKCVVILVERDGMTYEEAREFLEFNSIGAWVGENTLVWFERIEK